MRIRAFTDPKLGFSARVVRVVNVPALIL